MLDTTKRRLGRARLWLLILPFLFVTSCNKVKPNKASMAEESRQLEEGVKGEWKSEKLYVNQHFGFSVEVPEGWYLQKGASEAAEKQARKISGKSELVGVNPFWIFRHPPESGFEPSVNCSLQILKLPAKNGIKDGAGFFKLLRTQMVKNTLLKFLGEARKESLAGEEWWVQELSREKEGVVARQKQFCRILDDVALVIGIKYDEGKGEKEAELMEEKIKLYSE